MEKGGCEAKSLTMMSKDDYEKTTLLEKEGHGKITNVRDGQDHLREVTLPTTEKGGGCTPTY